MQGSYCRGETFKDGVGWDKVIDIQNWTRKEEYLFFRTFLDPMISVTVEVDCTTAYRKAKERQQPFSLYYMHAAVTAANRIEEFRYRQVGEEVILYERIDLFTPVQNADGSYRSVRLPAIETFEDFPGCCPASYRGCKAWRRRGT